MYTNIIAPKLPLNSIAQARTFQSITVCWRVNLKIIIWFVFFCVFHQILYICVIKQIVKMAKLGLLFVAVFCIVHVSFSNNSKRDNSIQRSIQSKFNQIKLWPRFIQKTFNRLNEYEQIFHCVNWILNYIVFVFFSFAISAITTI